MKKTNILNFSSSEIENRNQRRILGGEPPACDCVGGPQTEQTSVKQNGNTYRACYCEDAGSSFRTNVLVMIPF